MSPQPVSCVLLILVLFLIAAAIGRRGSSYVCARCRYPVAGLGGPRCPECGQDLNAPGVRTPAWQPRATIIVRTAAVTALALALAIVTWRVFPKRAVDVVRMRVTVGEHDEGVAVDVVARGREWQRWRPRPRWGRDPVERARFTLSWAPGSPIPARNTRPLRLDGRDTQRIRSWLGVGRGGASSDDDDVVARIDRIMTFGCAGDLLRMLDQDSGAEAMRAGGVAEHRRIRLVTRYHAMYAVDWPDLMAAALYAVAWIAVTHRLWTGPSSRYARWDELPDAARAAPDHLTC